MIYEERIDKAKETLREKGGSITAKGVSVAYAKASVAMQATAIKALMELTSTWTPEEIDHYLKSNGYLPEKERRG